jgi:hypothetical protein
MEGIFLCPVYLEKSLLMAKRPDFTPEQAGHNSKKFSTQPLNLGNGKEMVCIKGVWRLKGSDTPPPVRLDELYKRKRDRIWRQQYE